MRVCIGLLLVTLAACDLAAPEADVLVVQAYFQPNRPLPPVLVSRAMPFGRPDSGGPVSGATVEVLLGESVQPYRESSIPGTYHPAAQGVVLPGQRFSVLVRHEGDIASGGGVVPPGVSLDSVRVLIPDAPIRAVLLDSLALPLDSLAVSRTGFLYPIDVTLWWQAPGRFQNTDDFWVETSVVPIESFSSRLIDFFLPSSSVLEEPPPEAGQRSWTGLYAVPVESAATPVPAHRIRVGIVRGTLDYARFALSRNDPDRREPISNVVGGRGVIAGIAIDSLSVYVE